MYHDPVLTKQSYRPTTAILVPESAAVSMLHDQTHLMAGDLCDLLGFKSDARLYARQFKVISVTPIF